MKQKLWCARGAAALLVAVGLCACAAGGSGPRSSSTATAASGGLRNCDGGPHCVSSLDRGSRHVEPLRFNGDAGQAMRRLREVLEALPGLRVVYADAGYLRAEARTPLLGFVDDLEFRLAPAASAFDLRSSSRVGYWDLGTNRRRVEAIRQAFGPP